MQGYNDSRDYAITSRLTTAFPTFFGVIESVTYSPIGSYAMVKPLFIDIDGTSLGEIRAELLVEKNGDFTNFKPYAIGDFVLCACPRNDFTGVSTLVDAINQTFAQAFVLSAYTRFDGMTSDKKPAGSRAVIGTSHTNYVAMDKQGVEISTGLDSSNLKINQTDYKSHSHSISVSASAAVLTIGGVSFTFTASAAAPPAAPVITIVAAGTVANTNGLSTGQL